MPEPDGRECTSSSPDLVQRLLDFRGGHFHRSRPLDEALEAIENGSILRVGCQKAVDLRRLVRGRLPRQIPRQSVPIGRTWEGG